MKNNLLKSLMVMAIVVTMVFSLVGCQSSEKKEVLNVYNWGDFIDEEVLKIFEEETGIKVNYELYATNEEMYTKIKNAGASYDVAVPSDYMIERMINEGLVKELDHSKIPNFSLIGQKFKDQTFDVGNKYSIPYFWGTVGIIYNTEKITDTIDSWDVLWDEKYKGQFTMIDSQRDSIMVALSKLGYSINTKNEQELEEAKELLIKQKPLVLAYVGDNVKDMLISGEANMAVVWSGEAGAVIADNPQFAYALPKEGSNIWFDNLVIPSTAKNVEAAHKFIDFLSRPDIAKMNAEYVGYATCNTETMKMLDPELFPSTYAYPLDEWTEGFEVFKDPGDFLTVYDRIWTEVKAN